METKDTLKPVKEARKRLNSLVGLTFKEPKDIRQLKMGWLDFISYMNSPEFSKYREAYGKVSLMVKNDDGTLMTWDKNPYYLSLYNFLQNFSWAAELSRNRIDSQEFQMKLGMMRTYLDCIETTHEPMEEIVRKQLSKS